MTWWALLLIAFSTRLVDAPQLAAHADSAGVSHALVWALAAAESGDGARGNAYVGQGQRDSAGKVVCREIGRMQLNPCGAWRRVVNNARCTLLRVRTSYDDNVHCALVYLTLLHRQSGSWLDAIRRYNGSGKQAEVYAFRVWREAEHLGVVCNPPQ